MAEQHRDSPMPHAAAAAARDAYAPAAAAARTPRETEIRAFAHVNGLLAQARDAGSLPRLAEAMHANVRLWSTLAVDAAQEGNALPPRLRAQVVSLAIWARTHMSLVLNHGASVDALIDVNVAVMKGLRGDPGAGA